MNSLAYPQIQISVDVSPSEAYALIQENRDNSDFIILDVRTSEEFIKHHIENADILDFFSKSFENNLKKLDMNKTYLVYCTIGGRSGETLKKMKNIGFREAYNIVGGILLWEEEGLPTMSEQKYEWNTINPEIYFADDYVNDCCRYAQLKTHN